MKRPDLFFGFFSGMAVAALLASWYTQAVMNPRIAQAEAHIAAAEAACGASPAAPANGQLDTHRRVFPGVNPNPLPATPNRTQADLSAARKRLAADEGEISALKAWQANATAVFPQWQKALTDCRAGSDSGWTVVGQREAFEETTGDSQSNPQAANNAALALKIMGALLGRNLSALAPASSYAISPADRPPVFIIRGGSKVWKRPDSSEDPSRISFYSFCDSTFTKCTDAAIVPEISPEERGKIEQARRRLAEQPR